MPRHPHSLLRSWDERRTRANPSASFSSQKQLSKTFKLTSSTLDDTLRLSEDSLLSLESVHGIPNLIAPVVRVDRSDLTLPRSSLESLLQPLDGTEVDLKTRAHDEVIVSEGGAGGEGDGVSGRREGGRVLRVKGEVGGDEGGDGTTKILLLFEPSSDESPSWLVVVPFGSLEVEKKREG